MSAMQIPIVIFVWVLANFSSVSTNYIVGTGMADATGPAAEVNLMGYAKIEQKASGIHMRLFSRAFIVAEKSNNRRVVFVSLDSQSISQILKSRVVQRLKALYRGLYDEKNVCMSGTHTHSGPGGYFQYLLYDITSLGFVKQSLDALVNGVVMSIQRAHNNMRPGNIYVNEGNLLHSSINRSPTAYLRNPATERRRYGHNTDKKMTVLKFVDSRNKPMGMISWLAVHCTSMDSSNTLISGDNKGYASQLFEASMNGNALPGKGRFVAAFAQSNEGDVSPNTAKPRCKKTGQQCNKYTSACPNKDQCIAKGPGKDIFESTKIIGHNQFRKAMDLFNSARHLLSGPVNFRHQFVDMSKVAVKIGSRTVTTCKPALGYSFAAGATDGPGEISFKQGDTSGNKLMNFLRNFLGKPSSQQNRCHAPKPILVNTGEMTFPYLWQPTIVDTQILRLGDFAIIAVPGEFTTMAGRRVREAVRAKLVKNGLPSTTRTVMAGLANTYSGYVTTFEEYQVQRYEGASTLYGPYTLKAYIQKFVELSDAMTKGRSVPSGPIPPTIPTNKLISLLTGIVLDRPPFFKKFGQVLNQPSAKYSRGSLVSAKFVSANPRNNLMTGGSFLTVERKVSGNWKVVATDANWSTKYIWKRTNLLLGESTSTVQWRIPSNQPSGVYRIRHFGYAKKNIFSKKISAISGTTCQFRVGFGRAEGCPKKKKTWFWGRRK